MIKRLKIAGIPTPDQDAAVHFWTTKMGFSLITDQRYNDEQRWIELGLSGAQTRVALFTPDGHQNRIGQFQSLSFFCDDLEGTVRELRQRGVQFEGEIECHEWGASAIFKDPAGNLFVLTNAP